MSISWLSLWLRGCKKAISPTYSSSTHTTNIHTSMHRLRELTCLLPTEAIKNVKHFIRVALLSVRHSYLSLYVSANDEKGSELTMQLHYRWAQGEHKERKSNRRMAQSHRMNNDINTLMAWEEGTVAISTRNRYHSRGAEGKDRTVPTIYRMHDGFKMWGNL